MSRFCIAFFKSQDRAIQILQDGLKNIAMAIVMIIGCSEIIWKILNTILPGLQLKKIDVFILLSGVKIETLHLLKIIIQIQTKVFYPD